MRRKYYRRRSNINTGIWLIGLGILWLTDLWWPGILILIGISMLVGVMTSPAERIEAAPPLQKPGTSPETADEPEDDLWSKEKETSETPVFIDQPLRKHEDLLPARCPACGGPVAENAHKVEWNGDRIAKCPFCDSWLNL